MMSPCANCGEREAGCHGSCGAYKEWRERCDAAKAAPQQGRPCCGVPLGVEAQEEIARAETQAQIKNRLRAGTP